MSVKLTNLAPDTTEDEIRHAMSAFGAIRFVRVPMRETNANKNRGFAFVTYEKREFAQRALEQQEITVDITTIFIHKSMKRPPRD
mmetsp:Transcript_17806/g.12757  ORF Transcript_17806/g.12757 Transcript_17806/m.12757 type:complete len:85 (+) Transcript_17806:560-814(+)